MFRKKREEKLKRFIETIRDSRIDLYFVKKLYDELKFRCDMNRIKCNLKVENNEFYFELIKSSSESIRTIYSSKFDIQNAFDLIVSGEYKKFFEDLLKIFK